MIRGIWYAIKQAFKQIFRNFAMTSASLFSITAMLLILGLFTILVVNVNLVTENAKKQFDTIQIYLLDETEEAQYRDMMTRLESLPGVNEVSFVPREEGLEILKAKWGDQGNLLDGLSTNPLPNTIKIEVSQIEYADSVVSYIKNNLDGIEDIKYYQTTVDKLIKISDFVKYAALVIILFLVIVSVVVVSNTVKITVLAREKEITIMKYVGATNWFIRGPFLVEGIIIGIVAAGISLGIISAIYIKVIEQFSVQVIVLVSTGMVPAGFLIYNLIYIFFALGISIGSIGSIISMRRFLDT